MPDVSEITGSAITVEEAKEKAHTWRVLVYGNPGTAKTHFCYTMPEPVCIIDTEQKAHDIAHKFDDKEVFIWEVSDYTEATHALDEALKVLRKYYEEEDVLGTLAVDSMSLMWDWAQTRHAEMAYPGRNPHEVDFGSKLQGEDDWQMIKQLHNEEFREVMVNSPFHLCWTAASYDDYGEVLTGDASEPPNKPRGENDNQHKCTEMLHMFEGPDGVPHANLKKAAKPKHRFGLLRFPTFDKVSEIIEDIDEAEQSDEDIPVSEITDQEVDIVEGDPDVLYRQSEEDEEDD
jgi:hypothetical protein